MNTQDQNDGQLEIPGLSTAPEMGAPSAMRTAVVATLGALHADQLLEPRHAALAQLALELADAVASGRRSGRASAAAMAAAQLLATLQALPAPKAADANAEWQKFVADLERL